METKAAAEKNQESMSLLLLDLDHFKAYNDRLGHVAGDEALVKIAALLKETSRQADHVARYGGEEFAVILPGARKLDALKIAERLRLSLNTTGLPLTLSAGLATFPEDAQDTEGLIKVADKALYEAKHTGKNKCVIAPK